MPIGACLALDDVEISLPRFALIQSAPRRSFASAELPSDAIMELTDRADPSELLLGQPDMKRAFERHYHLDDIKPHRQPLHVIVGSCRWAAVVKLRPYLPLQRSPACDDQPIGCTNRHGIVGRGAKRSGIILAAAEYRRLFVDAIGGRTLEQAYPLSFTAESELRQLVIRAAHGAVPRRSSYENR